MIMDTSILCLHRPRRPRQCVSVSATSEADEGTSGTFGLEDQPVDEIGGYAEESGEGKDDADVVARHGMSQAGSELQRDQRCPLLTNQNPRP
jgi:hypothetical protein